jgi:DNA-binding response OmpR family regulator
VLVVSPDLHRCADIVGALQRRGMPSLLTTNAPEALFWLTEEPPAMIVIDLRTEHSTALLAKFREQQRSVVALSDDAQARASALEAGCVEADPLAHAAEEIALKVRAFLKTRSITGAREVIGGPLIADRASGRLRWFEQELEVSHLLFELAAYLIQHSGTLVPARVLLRDVWGESWASPDKVHKMIWRLRHRLGLTRDSGFLIGRRSHGYGLFPDQASLDGVRPAPLVGVPSGA